MRYPEVPLASCLSPGEFAGKQVHEPFALQIQGVLQSTCVVALDREYGPCCVLVGPGADGEHHSEKFPKGLQRRVPWRGADLGEK